MEHPQIPPPMMTTRAISVIARPVRRRRCRSAQEPWPGLPADLWHREPAADLAGQHVRELGMARHRLDGSRRGIRPEGVRSAPILKNQRDRLGQTLLRRGLRPALPVGPRDLRAVRDVPPPVLFHHCRELVAHACVLLSPSLLYALRGL